MSFALRNVCILLAAMSVATAGPALGQNSISGAPPTQPRDNDAPTEIATDEDVGVVGADGFPISQAPPEGETFAEPRGEEPTGDAETSDRSQGRRTGDRRVRSQTPPVDPNALLRFNDRLERTVPEVEAPDRDPDGTGDVGYGLDERRGYELDPGPARRRVPVTRVPPVASGEVDLECKKDVQALRNEIDGKVAKVKALSDLIEALKAKANKLESAAAKLEAATYDTSGPTPRPLTAAELLSNKVKVEALLDQIQMINAQIDGAYEQRQGLIEEIKALESEIEGLGDCRTR